MKVISMNSEETEDFLWKPEGRLRRRLQAEVFEECRDFDRILFRCITEQEYLAILQAADVYIDTATNLSGCTPLVTLDRVLCALPFHISIFITTPPMLFSNP